MSDFVRPVYAFNRNLALEQRMTTVEESIERAGAQLTQIVTAAKVLPKHFFTLFNAPDARQNIANAHSSSRTLRPTLLASHAGRSNQFDLTQTALC